MRTLRIGLQLCMFACEKEHGVTRGPTPGRSRKFPRAGARCRGLEPRFWLLLLKHFLFSGISWGRKNHYALHSSPTTIRNKTDVDRHVHKYYGNVISFVLYSHVIYVSASMPEVLLLY